MLRRTLLATLLAAAAFPAAAQTQTITLAVTDVEGLEALQREWGPFVAAFEKASGIAMRFFPVNSRTAAVEAMNAKRVDFVLTGPAEYVVFRARTNAVPVVGFSRPDYYGNIVVLADSDYHLPADLKGKKVAFGSVGSTSRHLAPMQVLADQGVDPRRDIQPVHLSVPVQIESLKRGDVAAAGLNRTDLMRMREREKDTAFRVIARGRDLPDDVLIAGSHVPQEIVAKVRETFVAHSDALIAAIVAVEANRKYEGMRFIGRIKDSDFNYVRSMYRTIGQAQFSEFPGN
ncbi:phosphate/phosphite/phosphonate ABC transporter substrate-binding protein [Elioraea sp. Yellowstone]|jgi:phosphonate transport system substrate-binding protein|uniref:phosphate/phosphite/phosphonate ABC transporter substrate-binding protein n=1 Tax=Elioraea sp. Yellowstone TaxID=2592070 RepID=UPI001152BE03|nr:phosphate/phosphite/phosphonate ABC transporter substrate-binding protein [Elioraea sp. Yellowstone]TQF77890.1 phosphate/phosphite/phosphonate ABC transporter substrate-binding protein [Elioraea sp. Yellowstone]